MTTEPSAATLTEEAIQRVRALAVPTHGYLRVHVYTSDLTVALDALDAARHAQQQTEALMAAASRVVSEYQQSVISTNEFGELIDELETALAAAERDASSAEERE